MTANGERQGYYGCSFKSYQDTLYAKAGYQYYSNCYIEGKCFEFLENYEANEMQELLTIYSAMPARGLASVSQKREQFCDDKY